MAKTLKPFTATTSVKRYDFQDFISSEHLE
jgi:hypothetical protein